MNQIGYMDPTEEMNKRWLKLIQSKVPTVDLVDISAEVFPYKSHKRQFAPEYSYSSYLTMLEQEYAIGDYLSNPNCSLNISVFARQQMVMLIEEFNNLKEYKTDTLYLAVSLADRYLVNIAVKGEKAPCLISLAVVCMLMAAKMEQPISPSFNRMILLLYENHKIKLKKDNIINLEEKILRTLEFSVHHVSAVPFLERFLRIFGFDSGGKGSDAHQISSLAYKYCIFMQRASHYLEFRPSQIASAALLLAINISVSTIATSLGIR